MHHHVETNALICYIKRLADSYSGDLVYISLLPEALPLAISIDISVTTICILRSIYPETTVNITSSVNKSRIYLHIITSYWELEFKFLSVQMHSKTYLSVYILRSQPIALGYNMSYKTSYRWPLSQSETGWRID